MSVSAFDFGNETCVIAVARRRVVDVLQNLQGRRKTQSAVGFQGKVRQIGDDAMSQYMNNYKNTVRYMKRLLGRQFDDPELKLETPYIPNKLVKLPNGGIGVQVNYNDEPQVFSIEQLTAAMLTKCKQVAEMGLEGQRVSDCVIGVPPFFNDAQRTAMLDAAKIAGLNPLRLMNETTAIALAYGLLRSLPEKDPIKVMFVDVGHGSTNVAIVSFVAGKLTVVGTTSDRHLGGRNFDRALVDHLAQYIKTKYKLDVLSDTKATLKLFKECERIKITLSANSKVPFNIEYIMNDTDVSGEIERPQFEELVAPLLDRLCVPVQKLLDATKTTKEELYAIEVVGGAVRIPAVQRKLKEFFGRELSRTCDGDESVVRGCALQCAMLSPNVVVRQFEVHDVHPFAIDVAWGPAPKDAKTPTETDGHALLFSQNNVIPSVKMISFKDRDSFQLVARYEKPEETTAESHPVIGRWLISGVPNNDIMDKGKVKVKVKLDMNGIISVNSAQLLQEVPDETAKDTPMPDANVAPASPAENATPAPAPTSAGAAPMDEDDTEKSANMETDQKSDSKTSSKVKVIRTTLKVEPLEIPGLHEKDFNSCYEKEAAMNAQDKSIAETDERRNELESYVLENRSSLSSDLKDFVTDSDREKFLAALENEENWLYNDGLDAQKSDYINHLKVLKEQHGDSIKRRKFEFESREVNVSALKSTIGKLQQFVASTDEKYAHITAEERQKLLAEVNQVDQWLASVLIQQDKIPKNQNPVFTVAELQKKKEQLDASAAPVMNKPKPAPPKPEPKPEEAKADSKDVPMSDANAAPNAAPEPAKMETESNDAKPKDAMDLD